MKKILKRFSNSRFLGINYRNVHLIQKLNSKKSIQLVNDKVAFKKELIKKKIATPKIIAVYTNRTEIKEGIKTLVPPFVIKPSHGYKGLGILIIVDKTKDKFITSSGKEYSIKELQTHMFRILTGELFSSIHDDTVLIEEMIEIPSFFQKMTYKGLPDIRIIFVKQTPICAMLRLPTPESEGKANISRGALALEIDISDGTIKSLYNVNKKSRTTRLSKKYTITLPSWKKMLNIAKQGVKVSRLGFAGIDMTYHKENPIILECNGRPGLEIQNVLKRNLLDLISKKVPNM